MTAELAAGLAPGARVRVVAGGRHYDGTVHAVGLEPAAAGDGGGPLYALEVEFASSETLRVGGPATVELP